MSTKTNGKCSVDKDDQGDEGVEDARGNRMLLNARQLEPMWMAVVTFLDSDYAVSYGSADSS